MYHTQYLFYSYDCTRHFNNVQVCLYLYVISESTYIDSTIVSYDSSLICLHLPVYNLFVLEIPRSICIIQLKYGSARNHINNNYINYSYEDT